MRTRSTPRSSFTHPIWAEVYKCLSKSVRRSSNWSAFCNDWTALNNPFLFHKISKFTGQSRLWGQVIGAQFFRDIQLSFTKAICCFLITKKYRFVRLCPLTVRSTNDKQDKREEKVQNQVELELLSRPWQGKKFLNFEKDANYMNLQVLHRSRTSIPQPWRDFVCTEYFVIVCSDPLSWHPSLILLCCDTTGSA